MNVDDFNDWRERYDSMSVGEQRQFYSRIWAEYPDQNHHDPESALEFFASIPPGLRVQEIGGWQGHLAKRILETYDAASWDNFEICEEAVAAAVAKPPIYRSRAIDIWPWEMDNNEFDVLLMTHCIEHMRWYQFLLLIASGRWDWIYIEAPLAMGPTDWNGYVGTHVFEHGWEDVMKALRVRAYKVVEERRLGEHHGVVWACRP